MVAVVLEKRTVFGVDPNLSYVENRWRGQRAGQGLVEVLGVETNPLAHLPLLRQTEGRILHQHSQVPSPREQIAFQKGPLLLLALHLDMQLVRNGAKGKDG